MGRWQRRAGGVGELWVAWWSPAPLGGARGGRADGCVGGVSVGWRQRRAGGLGQSWAGWWSPVPPRGWVPLPGGRAGQRVLSSRGLGCRDERFAGSGGLRRGCVSVGRFGNAENIAAGEGCGGHQGLRVGSAEVGMPAARARARLCVVSSRLCGRGHQPLHSCGRGWFVRRLLPFVPPGAKASLTFAE